MDLLEIHQWSISNIRNKGGSTETQPPYNDGDIQMGDVKDLVTNDLYK